MYFRFICEYFCYQFGWNIIALCYLINVQISQRVQPAAPRFSPFLIS